MTHLRGVKPAVTPDADPLATVPTAPAWLSPDAKKEWRRIMPALVERRILIAADLGSVESYCIAAGRVRELERLLAASFDPKLWRAQNQALQTAKQLAGDLGLTPVSRARLPAGNAEAEDGDNPLHVGRGR